MYIIQVFFLFLSSFLYAQDVHIGFMSGEAPVSYVTYHDNLTGIGYDLIQDIQSRTDISTRYHVYHHPDDALSMLNENKINMLIGPFSDDITSQYTNTVTSHPYFIDELVLVIPKHSIYLGSLNAVIWNGLLERTLLFALILASIFTLLLYCFESQVHPHMKKCSIPEKISYCVFTIFACFCRDLLYDPVTSIGRLLVSIWMVISVILITVITSIVTSSIIFLHEHGPDDIKDFVELKQQNVGYIDGDEMAKNLLKELYTRPRSYETPENLLMALVDEELPYAVLPKSQYQYYVQANRYLRNGTTLTKMTLGYKKWVVVLNKHFAHSLHHNQNFLTVIDTIIDHDVKELTMFKLCKRYIDAPSHCVF